MEFVHEVTAYLENKPGRLAKICSALAQEKVDIRGPLGHGNRWAQCPAGSSPPTWKRPRTCSRRWEPSSGSARCWPCRSRTRPGSLAKVLEKLAAEHINVEYAYASTAAAHGKALGIFHTSNPKRACQILNEADEPRFRLRSFGGPASPALALEP